MNGTNSTRTSCSRTTSSSPTMNNCASNNNCVNSNIPLRRPKLNRTNSNISTGSNGSCGTPSKIPVTNPEILKWKHKYEEVEQKRKAILIENEKTTRKLNDLNKKHLDLLIKNESLETELFEKNEEYTKLTAASKNLYKEYETLKNQYETETGAMAKALKDASHWYKENKELKRRTMLLFDKDTVDEGVDACDTGADSDIENLNKTIKQLSAEVAELQTEVDTLKHIEFQTTEQNVKLQEDLETEKEENARLRRELSQLQTDHEQILRISEMMKNEIQDLRKHDEDQRNNVVILRKRADGYKKERNVLAHQSTLLLQDFNVDDGGRELILLEDIERLKRSIEEERGKHEEEVNSLQDKIEELEGDQRVEVLEERLKLVEGELQSALERAEKAEIAARTPPAPPLPPPPPMLPPPIDQNGRPPVVPLRVKRRSRVNVCDLADAIGVDSGRCDADDAETPKKSAPGVNDDIINAIKEGKFTLKKAKNENKKDRDSTKAVSEILNILGSLRRAPKKRQSQTLNDVQL